MSERMTDRTTGPIEQFVGFVRRRVNRHRLWTAIIWAVVAGAGLLVVVALAFVLRGYAVPGVWIGAAVAAAAFGGAIGWASTRLGVDQSARLIDRFYNLQDAVASYLHFAGSGRRDGYYALQAAQTRQRVEGLSPDAIRYQPPRRGLVLAAGLIAVAIPLSLRGPSAEVLERQRLEKAVSEATTAANEQLEQLVEELREETTDPFEKELVDPEQLRKWVDQLEATKDHKEALRQYAQLERQLNAARLSVQRKREEQLLDRAAEELRESRETQPLAEKLAQKNYDKAAEELASMAPEPAKQQATEARKALARLKSAAQRMASAARASRAASSGASSASATAAKASKSGEQKSANGAASSNPAGGSESAGGGELADNLEDLEAAVAELDAALQESQRQQSQFGESDAKSQSECQECEQSVSSQLNKLSKQLKKLAIRRNAEKKLNKLCEACSECQGGLCECLNPGAKPGGKKAGWGSNTARRDERDELVDNGQTTQLRGTKGEGPSLSTVEQADDGSGVSTRRGTERERQFARQFESFVQREDVPEQVKRGVKNYFQLIHQMDAAPASETSESATESNTE